MSNEWFTCDCQGHAVHLNWDEELLIAYLSMWERSGSGHMSLFYRLKLCWRMLRHGDAWEDEIVLDAKTLSALGTRMLELAEEARKAEEAEDKR